MDDQAGGRMPPATQSVLYDNAARIGAELVRVDGGTDPAPMVRSRRIPDHPAADQAPQRGHAVCAPGCRALRSLATPDRLVSKASSNLCRCPCSTAPASLVRAYLSPAAWAAVRAVEQAGGAAEREAKARPGHSTAWGSLAARQGAGVAEARVREVAGKPAVAAELRAVSETAGRRLGEARRAGWCGAPGAPMPSRTVRGGGRGWLGSGGRWQRPAKASGRLPRCRRRHGRPNGSGWGSGKGAGRAWECVGLLLAGPASRCNGYGMHIWIHFERIRW